MKEQYCKVKPLANGGVSLSPQSHSGARPQFVQYAGKPKESLSNKLGQATLGGFGETYLNNLTASKYNGGLLDKTKFKFIVGIDYLTLNLRGKLPIEVDEEELTDGEFRFVNTAKPTKHFHTIFNLYRLDILLGTLLAYPREGNQLKSDTIQLKIENQNFYDDTDLREILESFLFRFPIKFNNITRVDIYLDSYGFQNGISLNDLDYLLDSGQLITDTRVKDKNKFSKKVDNRFITTGFTWGSRSTGRYLRIYNKTLELESGNKPWINKHHELNGLVDHDVFRFEYELKNSFLKHIKNFEWTDIFNSKGHFELLDIARNDHFSFVVEDGQKVNKRKPSFVLYDWEGLREYPKFIYDYSWKRKLPLGHSLRSVQVMTSSLLKHYVMNNQPEATLHQIKQILETYDLIDWFQRKKDDYLKKYLLLRVHNYEFQHQKLNELWS